MKILCTYCSKHKNESPDPLPAIERYISVRIQRVSKYAKVSSTGFYILSGKFGLIPATAEIVYYNHLLTMGEVNKHAIKVSRQLEIHNITQIDFYTRSVTVDPGIQPYLKCIELAAAKSGVRLNVIIDKSTQGD